MIAIENLKIYIPNTWQGNVSKTITEHNWYTW